MSGLATPPEQLILLDGRGLGAASEAVVSLGERRGYTVGATGPGTFRLVRSVRPTWAVVLAVIFMPVFGLGLLFLRVRRTQSGVITVFEDRQGTRARIVGDIDDELVQGLSAIPQKSVSAPPRGSNSFAPSRPVVQLPPLPDVDINTNLDADVERTIARPRRPSPPFAPASVITVVLPDGRALPLTSELLLGRAPVATGTALGVVLDEPSMSKTHVSIVRGDGGAVVTDLHSTNGTSVTFAGSTRNCSPGEPVNVPVGGQVGVGEITLEIGVSA